MQQCCDHPYLVDETLLDSLPKGHPVTDILDIEVRASGKLLLLEKMLRLIKEKRQRVLILSQVSVLWYHASNNLLLPLFNFVPINVVMPVTCDSLLVLVSKELASINVLYFLKACIIYFRQPKHAMISFNYLLMLCTRVFNFSYEEKFQAVFALWYILSNC